MQGQRGGLQAVLARSLRSKQSFIPSRVQLAAAKGKAKAKGRPNWSRHAGDGAPFHSGPRSSADPRHIIGSSVTPCTADDIPGAPVLFPHSHMYQAVLVVSD